MKEFYIFISVWGLITIAVAAAIEKGLVVNAGLKQGRKNRSRRKTKEEHVCGSCLPTSGIIQRDLL